MNAKELTRVVFHSQDDLSAGYNLRKAGVLLSNLDIDAVEELNDLLELYHIKLYFDHNLFLKTWEIQRREKYREQVKQSEQKVKIWVVL